MIGSDAFLYREQWLIGRGRGGGWEALLLLYVKLYVKHLRSSLLLVGRELLRDPASQTTDAEPPPGSASSRYTRKKVQ